MGSQRLSCVIFLLIFSRQTFDGPHPNTVLEFPRNPTTPNHTSTTEDLPRLPAPPARRTPNRSAKDPTQPNAATTTRRARRRRNPGLMTSAWTSQSAALGGRVPCRAGSGA
ncbi:hypothetical protein MSAN_00299900 [Mycena sanguinolenta]|uniref:Secreted protein n=1 Tax=Mycena sanguinolenta TaxID=230812 RepID=A0A8H6ZDB1_9AGAR|nr:hypothetical protein MSAN_00299900 [Mycena sanguinolenta]